MIRRTPRSTRTDTLFPYTTLFRSVAQDPSDEPAILLIKELAADRGDGELRHSKVLANAPFAPPSGWLWTSMSGILGPSRDISYGVLKLGPEPQPGDIRSDKRRVGKECGSRCKSRWSTYLQKKKNKLRQ